MRRKVKDNFPDNSVMWVGLTRALQAPATIAVTDLWRQRVQVC